MTISNKVTRGVYEKRERESEGEDKSDGQGKIDRNDEYQSSQSKKVSGRCR